MKTAPRPRIAIVGAGRLGAALFALLPRRGYRIGAVVLRRTAAAKAWRARPGRFRVTLSPVVGAREADLILLAVPDGEIETLAQVLAAGRGLRWSSMIVLDLSGALGVEPLESLRQLGADVGVLHPLQSISGTRAAARVLAGSRARIEGTPRASRTARRIAKDLGLVPLRFARPLDAPGRALYHAAAALAGNDTLALLDVAAELLVDCGVERAEAVAALAALARGALSQVEARGLGSALTGPVARGDTGVLAEHLRVLRRKSPETGEIHRLLSRRLLQLASRSERPLSAGERRRIARLLAETQ